MSYQLKIITPQGKAYESDVEHTRLPGEEGFVGVLSHHAPYITSSSGGSLLVREKGGQEKKFLVGYGFFEVQNNVATLMTESFKDPNAQEE